MSFDPLFCAAVYGPTTLSQRLSDNVSDDLPI
jgi:hypothetical protein